MTKKLLILIIFLCIIFPLPWLWFYIQIPSDFTQIKSTNHAIVFGAIVHKDEISPLHQERLDMAILLYESKHVSQIIVSNTPQAAHVMYHYLVNNNIPSRDIFIDDLDEVTHQSCLNPSLEQNPILLSQTFHLPRILHECRMLGVHGQAVPVEWS